MSEIRMRYVGRHQEPFGDTKTIWEIESDLPKHKVMEWLKAEVLDEENWELNAVANGEVICRKFRKLGWLDVEDGYYVDTRPTVDKEYLIDLIQEAVYDGEACAKLIDLVDRPTGECRTCARNADNGGYYEPEHRTRCPIQEHYALLLDGYCHLYEPYDCGAKMGGEDSE